jgi:asparagine synthase (glutamine-hydrolysing)
MPVRNLYDLTILSMQTTSIPYQLHSEDRNSMAFSVESRVPFLDHVLVETAIGQPEDHYFNGGTDKLILREGLKGILPEKIYNRKTKLGFASSDEIWMKQNGEEVKNRLKTAVEYFKGILKPDLIDMFDEYLRGQRGYHSIFFRVLSLYAWAKATKIKLS